MIISPYFPPSNAADMHRVRMSLPYFKQFGWEPEVVCVDEQYSDLVKDELLVQSLPVNVAIHKVKALSKKLTSKFGFGSLAFRALWYYRKKVNALLMNEKYDLIYFSTTQFPICVLGAYWQKRFNIPYVIDMQDPWYSDYYEDRPKVERPPKYRIVYWLHRKMEAIAMKKIGGLVSVSKNYVDALQHRYPGMEHIPSAIITFGAFDKDFEIVLQNKRLLEEARTRLDHQYINYVYIGRGGADMEEAVGLLFEGFKIGLLKNNPIFSTIRFHFLGTSYAPSGTGIPSILPLAQRMGISDFVSEQTDRLPYYETIAMLLAADGLILPGSDSPGYTASKLFPYIMAEKPLLAVFHGGSSTVSILKECSPGSNVVTLPGQSGEGAAEIYRVFQIWAAERPADNPYHKANFSHYSASSMTRMQVLLFNKVLSDL
ncbi:glycosyltransferase family protein [Mucilaginibacter sp.]